jgi:hypothetical protein
MTRLTIDLPDNLHRTLKSLSVIDGQTMRNIAIDALKKYTKSRIDENGVDDLLKPVLLQYANQIEEDNFKGEAWEKVKKEIK